jgi:predicted RNA-binding Zn ribbon-like protein
MNDEKLIDRAVKAYTDFVVHKLVYHKGKKYLNKTADDVLAARWPRYSTDRIHRLGYHTMADRVINIAEKALPDVLRERTNLRICAHKPCRNVIADRARVDQVCCSRACSGERAKAQREVDSAQAKA